MKKIWYILLLLLVISSSCQDKWDNFYGEGEDDDRSVASKLTLWETIEQEPRYSKFKLLLEETRLDEELNRERILTVWLPSDDYITADIMALDSFEMRRFVLHHMNSLALYKTKLVGKYGLGIETLAEKYVGIDGSGDNVSVEKIEVNKFDRVCTNGVIHEIAGFLTPTKNIMEYIMECGDEYSVYRDSLIAYNDTVFNVKESPSIGINEFGQTIYDSVFDITNSLLKYIDFADEEGKATLFLPSNKVIDEMIEDLGIYYDMLGLEIEKRDTLACFEFLMGATFLSREMTNFSGFKTIYTSGGKILQLDKQIFSTNYEQCSNGVIYEFQKLYMPRGQLMQTVVYEPFALFELPELEWSDYYQYKGELNVKDNIFIDDYQYLAVEAEEGESIELVLTQKSIYGEIKPVKLMPGKYKMEGKGYGSSAANVKIYLNNQVLLYKGGSEVFPMGSATDFPGDNYRLMCDTIMVTTQKGKDILRIEASGTGTEANSIKIRALKLTPVGDNY